jgi:hypothetical protein
VIVTFQQKAPTGSIFAPGCFDTSVGKTCPVTVDGRTVTGAVIRAYQVVDDGAAIEVTIEIPDETSGNGPAPTDPMRLARQHYPDVQVREMRPESGR